MGRVEDKVVLITGGARGQGRSHAVKLAEEGADVILFDICHDIETNEYALATSRDLEEAGLEVEKTGRKAYTAEVDVRDRAAVNRELANAVAEFGKLDVVVANAGICPLGTHLPVQAFADAFDVDFVGVVNTVHAALPYLTSGASIITTGSVGGLIAGLLPPGAGGPQGPGGAGYNYAKQLVDSYTLRLAAQLAPQSIRANVIHPTNVNTPMLNSEPMYRQFRPDLEAPGRDDALLAFPAMQAMPTPVRRSFGHLERGLLPGLGRVPICDGPAVQGRRRRHAEILGGTDDHHRENTAPTRPPKRAASPTRTSNVPSGRSAFPSTSATQRGTSCRRPTPSRTSHSAAVTTTRCSTIRRTDRRRAGTDRSRRRPSRSRRAWIRPRSSPIRSERSCSAGCFAVPASTTRG